MYLDVALFFFMLYLLCFIIAVQWAVNNKNLRELDLDDVALDDQNAVNLHRVVSNSSPEADVLKGLPLPTGDLIQSVNKSRKLKPEEKVLLTIGLMGAEYWIRKNL